MKRLASLLILTLSLASCTKTPVTAGTPTTTPNQGLLDAAEAVQVACEVAAPLAGGLGTLISQVCPPFVTGLVSIIESNGTVAALNALLATLRSEVAAVPGASSNKAVADILAGAAGAVAIYEAATGQGVVPAGASPFFASSVRKVKLTAAEKDRLKALRARAEKLRTARK